MENKKYKETFYLLFSYTVITFIITWPWLPNFLNCFPSDGGDAAECLHELYTIIKSLKNFSNPFIDKTQLYPFGSYLYHIIRSLIFYFPALLYFITGNFIFSINILLLLSFIFSGFFSYKLINYFCKDKIAAFIGSLLFAFMTKHALYLLGHYFRMMTMFIPLFLYLYTKFIDEKKYLWKETIVLTFVIILLYCCEPYIFCMTLLYIPFFELWLFITKKNIYFIFEEIKKRWIKIIVMLLPSMIISFYLLATSEVKGYSLFNVVGWLGADVCGVDLASIVMKSAQHTIKLPFIPVYNFSIENNGYIGLFIILLIISACIIKKIHKIDTFKFLLFFVIIYFLFSFGPYLNIKGVNQFDLGFTKFKIPIPLFFTLNLFSFLRNLRVANRFAEIGILFVAIIFSISINSLFEKQKKNSRKIIMIFIGIFILIDHLCIPICLEKYVAPPVFTYLQNKPHGTLLYLPYAIMGGEGYVYKENFPHSRDAHIFVYQNTYDKDLIFGYSGRTQRPMLFLKNHEILNALYYLPVNSNVFKYFESIPEKDKDNFIQAFNIKYILIGSPLNQPYYLDSIRNFFKKFILEEKHFFSTEIENTQVLYGNTARRNTWKNYNNSVLFTTQTSIPDTNVIKINNINHSFYLCYIRDKIETSKDREDLYFLFPRKKESKKLNLKCYAEQGDYDIYISDIKNTINMPVTGDNTFTFDLNESDSDCNIIGRITPHTMDKNQKVDFKLPENIFKSLPISIKSFGYEGFGVTENSLDYISQDIIKFKNFSIERPGIGINLVLIDPEQSEPCIFKSENYIASEKNLQIIKNVLLSQKDGTVLIISTFLDGSNYLTQELINILKQQYGAIETTKMQNLKGVAYIFVGVKNKPEIKPIEAISLDKLNVFIDKDSATIKSISKKFFITEAIISN